MKSPPLWSLLALLAAGGCLPNRPPAPEELAIDRFEEGERLLADGRVTDAAIEFEYALQHRPRWKAPYARLALCHEKLGRDNDAVVVYERLLQVDGTDVDALRGLGAIYARLNEAARALEYYRKLKALHPEDNSLDAEIARLEALRKP
ncbi:MAG TPA: tetratricopeptide repeat protein [Planctomycetota bacterium]|nr:tetratricopeptide repeat protein [Planctomycetota bacterium]